MTAEIRARARRRVTGSGVRGDGEGVADDLPQLLDRDDALAQDAQAARARGERGRIDDRRARSPCPRRARRPRPPLPRRGRPRSESPSIAAASAAVRAAGRPVRLADDTASGPVSESSSSAIVSCGMRSATVPLVSPRSQTSDGEAGSTTVRPPGQNAFTSASTSSGTRSASAARVGMPGTSTGGGDWRPRPFASSRRWTAAGLNASAATP